MARLRPQAPPQAAPDLGYERRVETARKGRGAVSNRAGRFEEEETEAIWDGWQDGSDEDSPPLRTTVTRDKSRSVIARNTSPDLGFDQSINPYRGCEHGCVYCFARPTHAWLGLSPGLDFESRLFAKPGAPRLLRQELARPRYQPKVIALGTNTDPYQPIERQHQITRGILKVLAEHRHAFSITTKSALVTRDIDVIAPMAADGLASVAVSVTTLDRALANKLEPRAPTPPRRLDAIAQLARAGIPVAVMAAPVIPALTDHELDDILAAAAAAGACAAGYILLRLPLEIRELFEEWLRSHVPDRADRVLNRMRAMRDGSLYVDEYGTRMRGTGPYAELLQQRFATACARHGLSTTGFRPDMAQFRRPPTDERQLAFL